MATQRERLNELRALSKQSQGGQVTTQKPQASKRQRLNQLRALSSHQQAPTEPALTPFPEQLGETRAARELPEVTGDIFGSSGSGLLSGEDKLKGAGITPILLATTDPLEFANILKSTFPENINFQTSPAGEVIVVNNATGVKALVNKSGFSAQDVLQTLGIVSAFTPAARGAALASGVGGKALAGAIGAGLTQATIEDIQGQLGGEVSNEEIAIASALGGAAEVVVPAIQAIRQSRRAAGLGIERAEVAATREAIRPAQEAAEAIEQVTGQRVGLFPAQQTQVPSELLKQRLLPQLDAGAKKAAENLENQNKEVFEATSELLNTIAGPEVVETGAKRFRSSAQKAIQAAKDARSTETKELFNNSLSQGAEVDVKPVRDLIAQNLEDAPQGGEIVKAMTKIKGFLSDRVDIDGNDVAPSLRQLQKSKFEIDNMLEKFGENALGNTTKRDVVELKRLLVSQMEEASPLYKEANEEFARLSPAITELEDSIVGAISNISNANLQNISRRIFSPNSNPAVIKNAKEIIDKVDPGAWNDMLRTELQRRFGGIETLAEDIPGELVGNVPGQLRRAIFGNPEQRRTLLSAMNSEQRKNFVYLDQVLQRASSGRAAGSPTAPFGEVLDRLKGTAGVIRDVIFRPLQTLQETGERGLFDRNVAAMTKVMFDPRFEPQLRQLRAINSDSPAAARAFTQLINTAQDKENK